jgi:hypothetical protein
MSINSFDWNYNFLYNILKYKQLYIDTYRYYPDDPGSEDPETAVNTIFMNKGNWI